MCIILYFLLELFNFPYILINKMLKIFKKNNRFYDVERLINKYLYLNLLSKHSIISSEYDKSLIYF